jgi:hypothetical protein
MSIDMLLGDDRRRRILVARRAITALGVPIPWVSEIPSIESGLKTKAWAMAAVERSKSSERAE